MKQHAEENKIEITRVKKYNANWNHVISVNGTPVAITKSANRANEVVAYLMGQDADLNDGTLVKQLDYFSGHLK
nr:hypothetical protein [Lactiplantibacillus plantarum]